MDEKEKAFAKLEKYKYPLLILLIGLLFLLLPSGSAKRSEPDEPDLRLQELLSCTEGIGETRVLISDSGVVVICRGAENPRVRLDIIRAVGSYTGFGSDKITVLKMAENS